MAPNAVNIYLPIVSFPTVDFDKVLFRSAITAASESERVKDGGVLVPAMSPVAVCWTKGCIGGTGPMTGHTFGIVDPPMIDGSNSRPEFCDGGETDGGGAEAKIGFSDDDVIGRIGDVIRIAGSVAITGRSGFTDGVLGDTMATVGDVATGGPVE